MKKTGKVFAIIFGVIIALIGASAVVYAAAQPVRDEVNSWFEKKDKEEVEMPEEREDARPMHIDFDTNTIVLEV